MSRATTQTVVSARSLAGLVTGLASPDEQRTRPAYRDLAERVRRLIVDARVPAGAALPSERTLMAALGVSRTTVTRAYAELRNAGYLTSRQGSGSVVTLPGASLPSPEPVLGRPHDGDSIDLTYAALPAVAGTLEAYERAVSALPRHLAATGYQPFGLLGLRAAIAAWFDGRGLPTGPDQIVVTNGAHAALVASIGALGSPGARIAMEVPTYPNAIAAVRHSRLRPVGVPMTAEGWDTSGWRSTLKRSDARLSYLIPDFQNPTGALMSDEQRADLGHALETTDGYAIVDETFVDLCIDLPPGLARMPLPTAAFSDRVITVGGLAKSCWGGLRIGWARLPHDLVEPVVLTRHALDLGTPVLEQLVAIELLGRHEEIAAERQRQLRAARDELVAAFGAQLPQWRVSVPRGGICLWVELPQPRSSALARAVASVPGRRLHVSSGARFGVGGGLDSFLRVPFSTTLGRSSEVVGRLHDAWQSLPVAAPTDDPLAPFLA